MLVDDESPVPTIRGCGSEILEIKSEDREVVALRVGHQAGVDETQIEVAVLAIYLCCPTNQALRHEVDGMLSPDHCRQKFRRPFSTHTRSEQLVHLADHGVQNDEVPPQLRDQGGG